MYRLTEDADCVVRISDSTTIPRGHRWWADYEEWMAAGNTQFPAPSPTVDQTKAVIAARRYQAEISGTTIQGLSIDTGRDSQGLIAGAALAALIDPGYMMRWKTTAGFVQLSSSQIIAVASGVRAHVQACFDREADLLDALSADALTETLLETGWPD